MSSLALAKKELRQNAFIFSLPYLIGLGLLVTDFRNSEIVSKQMLEILAIIIPISLAGAYGLQSFDLEENGQTRDFLLTKPLTVTQIIWTKYWTGLSVLLPISVLWIWLLLPSSFLRPSFLDWSSFWLVTIILMIITVYTQSFITGIIVKGPLKIIAALILTALTGCWFFYSWSQGIMFLYWYEPLNHQGLNLFLLFLLSIILTVFQIRTCNHIAIWHVGQINLQNFLKELKLFTAAFILLPALLTGLVLVNKPAFSPFNQLFSSLFASDKWFVAIEGLKQPSGNLYAFFDNTGRLGLAPEGKTPHPVYKATHKSNNNLSNLAWSPDGQKVLFTENRHLKIYDLKSKKIATLASGDIGLWSFDSSHLICAQKISSQPYITSFGKTELVRYQLSLMDLKTHQIQQLGQFSSSGTALAWDSKNNRLLTIDISGSLMIIDMYQNKVSKVPLGFKKPESVFLGKFEPIQPDKGLFKITVYSFDLSNREAIAQNHYNVQHMLFNCDTNQLTQLFKLSQLAYSDIITTGNPRRLLVRSNSFGIYRELIASREAEK